MNLIIHFAMTHSSGHNILFALFIYISYKEQIKPIKIISNSHIESFIEWLYYCNYVAPFFPIDFINYDNLMHI